MPESLSISCARGRRAHDVARGREPNPEEDVRKVAADSIRSLTQRVSPLTLGREKNSPGADFPDAAVESAKILGAGLQSQSMMKIDEMTVSGSLKEICNAKKKQ